MSKSVKQLSSLRNKISLGALAVIAISAAGSSLLIGNNQDNRSKAAGTISTTYSTTTCWNQVVDNNDGTYGWPAYSASMCNTLSNKDSIPSCANKSTATIPLNESEIIQYKSWLSFGMPAISSCGFATSKTIAQPGRLEDTDKRITYIGSWPLQLEGKKYKEDYHVGTGQLSGAAQKTIAVETSASFKFVGCDIGLMHRSKGPVRITVDGKEYQKSSTNDAWVYWTLGSEFSTIGKVQQPLVGTQIHTIKVEPVPTVFNKVYRYMPLYINYFGITKCATTPQSK